MNPGLKAWDYGRLAEASSPPPSLTLKYPALKGRVSAGGRMKGLIIDTSQDPALLGIVYEGKVETMVCIEGSKNLSATLFPKLRPLFKDLDYIAVGIGPGSYMGIRTGATIAKTLAFASALPLIEFASPLAFIPNKEGTFAFIGDAKMGQLYVMTGDTGKISELSRPQLIAPEQLNVADKDFIVRAPLEPNLDWVAMEVHTRFIQKKFSSAASLELTYLRH